LLCSAYDCVIPARGKGIAQTDLSIAIPSGTYARVAPRSGLAVKHFIDTGAGVVDEDYRGNIGVVLFNHSDTDFKSEFFCWMIPSVSLGNSCNRRWVSGDITCSRLKVQDDVTQNGTNCDSPLHTSSDRYPNSVQTDSMEVAHWSNWFFTHPPHRRLWL